MALQPWIGRTAGQLDADSPLDITLFNGIDDDILHLKQVLYGDGATSFFTATNPHNHDGITSAKVGVGSITSTEIAANAVTASELALNSVDESHIVANAVRGGEFYHDNVTSTSVSVGAGATHVFGNYVVTVATFASSSVWYVDAGIGYVRSSGELAHGTVFSNGSNFEIISGSGGSITLYWEYMA